MKVHEVAGKTRRECLALAARYGYGQPVFTRYSGALCVMRFELKS